MFQAIYTFKSDPPGTDARTQLQLGRKNFLFVGHLDAGKNLAGLYSLVAMCEGRGINPFAYLADVVSRIDDASRE